MYYSLLKERIQLSEWKESLWHESYARDWFGWRAPLLTICCYFFFSSSSTWCVRCRILLICNRIYPRWYLFAIAYNTESTFFSSVSHFFFVRLRFCWFSCVLSAFTCHTATVLSARLNSTLSFMNRIDWASAKQIYTLIQKRIYSYFIFDNVVYILDRFIFFYSALFVCVCVCERVCFCLWDFAWHHDEILLFHFQPLFCCLIQL